MRYFKVKMKDGSDNYLSYDAVELQRNDISEVVVEISRDDFMYFIRVKNK